MIAHEHLAEVQDTDSPVAPVDSGTTWRDALLARLHPADRRISDEDIFAILNDDGDGQTAAELRALHDVTVPMYCVWKTKYRQMSLDGLRDARRREQRRRYTVIGVALLVPSIAAAAIVVGLAWTLLSVLTSPNASPIATVATISAFTPVKASVKSERIIVSKPEPTVVAIDAQPQSDAGTNIVETGYRIQIAAADTEQQGRAMVAKLASAGYPAYMTRVAVNTRDVFRVRVGPFETLTYAEEVAADLRSAGYSGAWIAR